MTRRAVVGAAESGDAGGAVVSSCISCGRYCAHGSSYCSRHLPKRDVSVRGGGAAIARFRRAVGERAGWRCEAIDIASGKRCAEARRSELEAHHLGGVALHNDPNRGVMVCKVHHLVVERAERKRRAALAEAERLNAA